MDSLYKKNSNGKETISTNPSESQIQKFYAGKSIFLTGSTGFMGKVLVEKYLRSCPDIKRLYVLIRPKRGSSFEERMKTFFDDVLFQELLKANPGCKSKVYPVSGDLVSENLGMSEADRNLLIEDVSYFIHNASNVRFTEKMGSALRINVLGTLQMLNFAKECKKVEAFMYVSTAFCHGYETVIREQVLEKPADIELTKKIIAAEAATKDGFSEEQIKEIIGHYPNVYCFTKATAEGLVDAMSGEVPFKCLIYRPSIVISTWKEPIRSWCGNMNGPGALFIGYGLGVMRTAYLLDYVVDLVPVDMTINSMIVSMWDVTENRPSNSGAFIFNYGTSSHKPITFRKFKKHCLPQDPYVTPPSIHTVWPQGCVFTECPYYFAILNVLFHIIPALLVDGYLKLTGKKAMAMPIYKKGMMNFDAVMQFIHSNYRLEVVGIHKAVDRLNATDRSLFYCDLRELDWIDYCKTYWGGLREYLLKDPPSTIPKANKKFQKLLMYQSILRYTVIAVVVYLLLWLFGIF
ncbi:putative fatty acyl-CoA reductase CG5065 [Venturia canescens]|uniref:putative fatty acyl-CoA reductase CG5065 n=1 Tax=Venturia canescens TaxID=32260 RepID=UPI001C9C89F7|nr:putative fatty acyl-CoA reductase CG5065 [Venturia canescens]XP_043271785.1 putative fatty acyl-CoA reductase CG5065 [Venturia canescens]